MNSLPPPEQGWQAIDELLDAWAFNVALECSATLPDEGKIALGGDVLSIHDLNTILQAFQNSEQRIVDWLRSEYASARENQNIPANAISMIDTIRALIEEGAHRQ